MAARKNRRKSPVVLEDLSKPSQWRLQHGSFSEPVREPDPESGVPRVHRYATPRGGPWKPSSQA